MNTLGERIRTLRKQQKLTLEALAGDTLTKGMLSLIENNKANPSMESLAYIAGRLDVDVAELLEKVSADELSDLLSEAEKLYHTDLDRLTDEHEQFLALVEPYLPKLTQGYESARLLEMYGRVLYFEKKDGWEIPMERAAKLYAQMNVTDRLAGISIFRAAIQTEEYHYQKALDTLKRERAELEKQNAYINPMIQLDFDYMESILYFAVGDSTKALEIMDSSIEFSRKKQVFYRIDHLYRLAVFHAMITDHKERLDYYLTKVEQYADFADDTNTRLFLKLVEIKLLISEDGDYKKALYLLEKYKEEYSLGDAYSIYYHLEKGIALFGLHQYDAAIEALTQVNIPNYMTHPFDLILFFEADTYLALCYLENGERERALTHATLAYKNVSRMPPLPHGKFIIETYEKMVSSGKSDL